MPTEIINVYEGYSKVNYRKNLYDPKYMYTGGNCTGVYVILYDRNGWEFDGNYSQFTPSLTNQIRITIVQSNGEIFTGIVEYADYNSLTNKTTILLEGISPETNQSGFWYYSDRAMMNGEDVRAYSLIHELSTSPTLEGVVLFNVGIKGVLS